MDRNSLFLLMIIAAVIIVIYFYPGISVVNEKYCSSNQDCACGVNINTGDCFFGNVNFVDTTRQCPDFCDGIAANLVIECTNNTCIHRSVIR